MIKGTSTGTTTDENGRFSLMVKQDDVLEISYVGFLTEEIVIDNRTEIMITLYPTAMDLEE
jgi:hypothetical protein